ncbi:hypothetical protein TNCV_1866482 [Trichonephila clavipes]|nr:hypothetical protein TNCV_1866482 [Trichonephila clavipes]
MRENCGIIRKQASTDGGVLWKVMCVDVVQQQHRNVKTGNEGGRNENPSENKLSGITERRDGHKSENPPHRVDMPKNSKSPSDTQEKIEAGRRISPMWLIG